MHLPNPRTDPSMLLAGRARHGDMGTPEEQARHVTGLLGTPVRLDAADRSPDPPARTAGVLVPGVRLDLGPEDWRDGHGQLGGGPLLARVRHVAIGGGGVFDGRYWPAVELEQEGDGAEMPWIYVRLSAIDGAVFGEEEEGDQR